MTRRKGKTTRNRLRRKYLHQAEFTLACSQVRGRTVRQYEIDNTKLVRLISQTI